MDSSNTQSAYAAIRERIVAGAYAPGQRLVLRALADEFGMSTVPVRDALGRLETEGWVKFRPNVGAEVRPIEASQWVSLMDTLALTEGHATAQAAHFVTAEDLARAEINEEMRAALERFDPLAASQRNQAFHAVFHERCPNRYLVGVVRAAAEQVSVMLRTAFVFVPTRTWAALDEHEQLIVLIEEEAPDEEIEHFAREHKLHTITAYLGREREAEVPDVAIQDSVRRALPDS